MSAHPHNGQYDDGHHGHAGGQEYYDDQAYYDQDYSQHQGGGDAYYDDQYVIIAACLERLELLIRTDTMQTMAMVKKDTTTKAMEGLKEMSTTTVNIMTKVTAMDMAITGKHHKPTCQSPSSLNGCSRPRHHGNGSEEDSETFSDFTMRSDMQRGADADYGRYDERYNSYDNGHRGYR